MVIRHPFNLGIGGAMQSGYKYALANGYDVAVQVDGDGQHKPEYLAEMLKHLRTSGDEADMVYGTRFRGDPGYKVPLGRRAGNLIFSVVLTAITRQKITDPDLRLPDGQPQGHRALRPRLPARLPRGRGDPDAQCAPPPHPRGRRADERPRLRPQLDRLPPLRLLHGEGAARDLRRPAAPPPDADGRVPRSTARSTGAAPSAATAGAGSSEGGCGRERRRSSPTRRRARPRRPQRIAVDRHAALPRRS